MPDDKLFFSKLVTKDLRTVESNRRLFEGILTVEMKDRQGEITIRDELLKVLPIWIARGGPITDTHSNRVVGQGINFGSICVTDSDGNSYPAITITGEIFKDYELDNEIWNAIKSGKYKGLSFGGATKSSRTPIMQKDGSIAYSLKDLEQYEVAVCEEPAVPLALITQHNEVAKAMAGNVQDRGDGTMCIRCDKFKCYVEKGDDTFSDVRGPNTPNKDEEAEALENNRGEPQENGATYHGTSKGVTYTDPNPKELNPSKIMENAKNPKTTITLDSGMKIEGKANIAEALAADDEKAMDKDSKEMLEEADLKEVEKVLRELADGLSSALSTGKDAFVEGANSDTASKIGQDLNSTITAGNDDEEDKVKKMDKQINKILPLIGAAAGAIGGAARAAAPAIAGAVRSAGSGAAGRIGSAASSAAGSARGAATNAVGDALGACESEDSCDGGFTCHSYTLDKKYESDLTEPEYGETNSAGEKVNRFGRKIPGVMSKKPSKVDTAQDTPGSGRLAGKPAPIGSPVTPSSPNMTGEALQRRQTGNWNKPSGKEQPKRDKVGNRQVRARSTVTHDKETGVTTVDPTKTRGGSKKIVRMPTESYFNNPKYVRGKALDLLNLALSLKFNFKPLTPDSRREHIQNTKVPGTDNNQNKLEQESVYNNTGKKIKPTGIDTEYTDEQIQAMKALEVIKVEYRKNEILREIKLLKADYNTDSVVREYTDDDEDQKKKMNTQSQQYTGEPPHGGNAGREPGETKDNESQSTLHPMNEPVKDEDADALKKEKNGVYSGGSKFNAKDPKHLKELGERFNDPQRDKLNAPVITSSTGSGGNECSQLNITKSEAKLHASVGSSNFIHDRHFITTDGKITAHNPKSHEEQVKGIGHKNLSSFMKETGAARVTHNDKTNEFSVHSHTPYTDSQTSTIRNHIRDNKIDPKSVIHDNYHDKGPGETGAAHTHNSAMFPKGIHTNMSDDVLSDVDKNDRAMAGVNAEDGVNGKMRLDNDEPAESFDEPTNKSEKKEAQNDKDINTGDVETIEGTFIDREANPGQDTSETLQKSINIADPGSGSGGIRVGGAYDNSQQGTGQKDDPRVGEEEEYTGEGDRGPRQKEPKYSGEDDTVTGSSVENYNKSILDLLKLQFDLKKLK